MPKFVLNRGFSELGLKEARNNQVCIGLIETKINRDDNLNRYFRLYLVSRGLSWKRSFVLVFAILYCEVEKQSEASKEVNKASF